MRPTRKVDSSAAVTLGGSSRGRDSDAGDHLGQTAAQAPFFRMKTTIYGKRLCFSKVVKKSSINF